MLKKGMRGGAVKKAQKLLHNSAYGNFRPGKADGVFGRKTARAARRAKYALGYRLIRCNGTVGLELESYLRQRGHLPPEYRKRRKHRIQLRRLALRRQFRRRAFTLAMTQVGYVEGRDSISANLTKYGEWYGLNRNPWCAMFVSWCYSHSGRNLRYAAVQFIYNDALAGRNGLARTGNPEQGDLVILFGPSTHVGMFDRWVDRSRGIFSTIEGNTSPNGSQTNGGMVARKSRFTNEAVLFVRVNRA